MQDAEMSPMQMQWRAVKRPRTIALTSGVVMTSDCLSDSQPN